MARDFDPNAASSAESGIFGLPYDEKESRVIYLPVPWEATTSYRGGTSHGPQAILEASRQIDLFDFDVEKPYRAGLFMKSESSEVRRWNEEAKKAAQKIIAVGGDIGDDPSLKSELEKVNAFSAKINQWVFEQTQSILAQGKIPAVVGGDHAVPLGAFQAMAEAEPELGILHLDAHSDTRKAFEGFTYSHASIMHNALEEIPRIKKLVQVGIRDFCEEEWEYCQSQGDRVSIFFDGDLSRRQFEGETWAKISEDIVSKLPQKVWISFDIDGLDPLFCPHTGTPVPGGFSFSQANYLLRALVQSGRKVVGFDLNEVAPNSENPEDDWDANVGARMLYKMTGWTLASQGIAKIR